MIPIVLHLLHIQKRIFGPAVHGSCKHGLRVEVVDVPWRLPSQHRMSQAPTDITAKRVKDMNRGLL